MLEPLMPIDVRQISTGQTGARRTLNSSDTASTPDKSKSAENVTQQDSVELSSTSKRVSSLLSEIATQPEVNESRVAQIRSSIASGEFSVSADKIASKLLALDFGHRKTSYEP